MSSLRLGAFYLASGGRELSICTLPSLLMPSLSCTVPAQFAVSTLYRVRIFHIRISACDDFIPSVYICIQSPRFELPVSLGTNDEQATLGNRRLLGTGDGCPVPRPPVTVCRPDFLLITGEYLQYNICFCCLPYITQRNFLVVCKILSPQPVFLKYRTTPGSTFLSSILNSN